MQSIQYIKSIWPILAIFLGWIISAGIASATKLEDIETVLRLDLNQITTLQDGEIVPFEVAEETKKELAVGLSVYLPIQPAQLVAFFKQSDFAKVDRDVITYHQITANDVNPFREFKFTLNQNIEARDLLRVKAGDRFNLSSEEIRSLKELKQQSTSWNEIELIESISEHYQKILLQRFHKYRELGLAGITPYAREKIEVKPADELRIAASSSKLLDIFSPDLYKFWLNYPAPLPPGTEENFSWLNRKVNNRPTAILSHRLLFSSNNGSLILTRQFFVGHTYNSSQLILGCLPFRNGSLVFYTHRISTDQVAGLGNKLKHNLGRERLKYQMINNLKGLRSEATSFNSLR